MDKKIMISKQNNPVSYFSEDTERSINVITFTFFDLKPIDRLISLHQDEMRENIC